MPESLEHSAASAQSAPRNSTQLHGREAYRVLACDDGGGWSRTGNLELVSGVFVAVRDADTGDVWGVPVGRGTAHDIETELGIEVSPSETLELRRVALVNRSSRRRALEITAWAEPRLQDPLAFASHPAFSKLFVQTEAPGGRTLLAHRRPRGRGESFPWIVFALAGGGAIECETDRARFYRRGQTETMPDAVARGLPLSGTVGNVLDPVLAIRARVEFAAGQRETITVLVGAAADRDGARAMGSRITGGTVAASPHTNGAGECPASPAADIASSAARVASASGDADGELLRFFNGLGGFSARGDEYVIRLRRDDTGRLVLPPRPWVNVIANETFGFLVSETGAASTWSANSREHRLTPWPNDPLLDPHEECLYLRDEETGAFWSPLPGPAPGPADYETRHGFGQSVFLHVSHGIESRTTMFALRDEPAKVTTIALRNLTDRPRRVALACVSPLVLGASREETAPFIVTDAGPAPGTMLAREVRAGDFAGRVAFAAFAAGVRGQDASITGDLSSFLGAGGTPARPSALADGGPLDGRTGADLDPCFAQRITVELPARQSIEMSFVLGDAPSRADAERLMRRLSDPAEIRRAHDEARAFWSERLSALCIETPSPALDVLVNGWLPYQTVACRLWARTALYQSGGAFGFRDQLQDASSLATTWPEATRAQLLLNAAHQFVEGDVLHWWHPPMSRGIRTRFADDLLWLPFLAMQYVDTTGDDALFDERAPFLTARPLSPHEDETFLLPSDSGTAAHVYEHCCRAIDRSLATGTHGLPLFGSGDWNDGMNRVGIEGRGESTWMGFFLVSILERFAPVCAARGDAARERTYLAHAEKLRAALNDAGWDGRWYRRGYFDDGAPLGSSTSDECQIDALAQAWAVLSGVAPAERARTAMDSVEQHLISDEDRLIRLLTPPFVNTPHDPGYIKGYVAGVRENGGQYTHAALWVIAAMAELGRRDRVAALLDLVNPIHHTSDGEAIAKYQVEPYVIAADVYGAPPHVGRGGWTWYTGSAGWMSRVAIESLLGVRLERGNVLRVKPCTPDEWPGFRVTLRLPGDGTRLSIEVTNPAGNAIAVVAASIDGRSAPVARGEARVPLTRDGGAHEIRVELGSSGTASRGTDPRDDDSRGAPPRADRR